VFFGLALPAKIQRNSADVGQMEARDGSTKIVLQRHGLKQVNQHAAKVELNS